MRTLAPLLGLLLVCSASALAASRLFGAPMSPRLAPLRALQESAEVLTDWVTTKRVFHFGSADREESLGYFERIDDVIMGGISSSKLLDRGDPDTVSWMGVLRKEGGGFCGIRTKPLSEPLDLSAYEGLYLTCRLASDTDADRRAWKMTLRTRDDNRGDKAYQAAYRINPDVEGLQRIFIPFADFKLVRGARIVPGAPQIDEKAASSIYQIGLSASKFQISENTTVVPNFRDGFFQLDIGSIGGYTWSSGDASAGAASPEAAVKKQAPLSLPQPLPENEVAKRRPVALRVLRPALNLFFSEPVRRGQRAEQILKERQASSFQILRFGLSMRRRKGRNFLRNILTALLIPVRELTGKVLGKLLRIGFQIPRMLSKGKRRP